MSFDDESGADGPTTDALPELGRARLDQVGVIELARQIERNTSGVSARTKGGRYRHSDAADLDLWAAVNALLARTTQSIQLRYRYSDCTWIDTLMAGEDGFDVVRIRLTP